MKLWEAMLKGAKAGPQLFNKQSDRNGGTCAMGALSLGLCGDPYNYTTELVESISKSSACPYGNCNSFTAGTVTCCVAVDKKYPIVIMHLAQQLTIDGSHQRIMKMAL